MQYGCQGIERNPTKNNKLIRELLNSDQKSSQAFHLYCKELQYRNDAYSIYPKYSDILTHCRLNRLSHTIYWKSPISILAMSGYEILIFLKKNGWTFWKQWRPYQMPGSAVSGLGQHYSQITLLGSPDYNGLTTFCRVLLPQHFGLVYLQ